MTKRIRIRTSYSGPTATGRGARIIARGCGRQLSVPYPYERNDVHAHVARMLRDRLGLAGQLVMVASKGAGFTFELTGCEHDTASRGAGGVWTCSNCGEVVEQEETAREYAARLLLEADLA